MVVYDDLDLPFGRIRIRPRGSAGGHRGMLSIIERLAGAPFFRVRVGIGRPPEGIETIDYVLERFNAQEIGPIGESRRPRCRGGRSLTARWAGARHGVL